MEGNKCEKKIQISCLFRLLSLYLIIIFKHRTNQTIMKKIIFILLAVFVCTSVLNAQSYKKVKVTLKEGQVITGSKGLLSEESISFKTGGVQTDYPLSKVMAIQAKQGKAGMYALASGCGCFSIFALAYAANPDSFEEQGLSFGQVMVGSLIWSGITAGAGAPAGMRSFTNRTTLAKVG